MSFESVVGYILGIMVIFVLAKICLKPIKFILKIVLNSVLGGAAIVALNALGSFFGIHIGLNAVTAVAVGIFGLPAAVAMLVLQIFF